MSKKYHIVYKTINIVNNKCYVGVHSTNKIDDGYIGCGVTTGCNPNRFKSPRGLKEAFQKYGMHNFEREILHIFDNREEAFLKEAEIVNLDWVRSHDNYNLCLGGVISGTAPMTESQRAKLLEINIKEYVIVNIKTGKVFEDVKNLTPWCLKNIPELVYKKGDKHICFLKGVVYGQSRAYKGEWWICRKEDWTGKVIIRDLKPRAKTKSFKKRPETKIHVNLSLYSPEGELVFIEDLVEFCKENKYDFSAFVKLTKNKHLHTYHWTTSIENHRKVVTYIMKNGQLIKIENIKGYCRDNSLDYKQMFRLKNKKIDLYKGYTRYEQ